MKTQPYDAEGLDLMATLMQSAARARGIETRVRQLDADQDFAQIRTWLSFTIKGQEFYYAKGRLLEYGKDRWGNINIGRDLNHEAALLVSDKHRMKTHLRERGFRVPEGRIFRRRHLQAALDAFGEFDGAICVKPNNGFEGKCVTTGIVDEDEFGRAVRRVAEHYVNIVIEESVVGGHYRFFYVHPEVVGIRRGIPLNVVGDGKSGIAELLATKNAERRRRALPTHLPIEPDEEIVAFLAARGLGLDHVPDRGETVFLGAVSNSSAGADTVLYGLDEVHPSYLDVVARACRSAPGLHFSGVDIIIRDVEEAASADNHWFLELNASPALPAFYYPWEGATVDVAGKILDLLRSEYPF
ncbi:Glutathione synthase [Thiorhodococcus drewsii AZ1]|uniref:Glutathione synthase n=1 Tax=Thiorhodococcus drewsii AZ1 TaxID=765913 RepID=G2E7L2_9GAMM|nr:hypothetical protein [Thiorhodococcus drewsii]EGV27896.1 Glutathione synthase [Thiorhodococcus drewsii AZ1]